MVRYSQALLVERRVHHLRVLQARDFYITHMMIETNPSMPLNKVGAKLKSGPVLMRPDRKRC
jgi:hypothetical protein